MRDSELRKRSLSGGRQEEVGSHFLCLSHATSGAYWEPHQYTGTVMESTFTIARIRGIPIGVNWSWLFVFALVVWSLTTRLFPHTYPGLGRTAYIVMGLIAAVLFFGSVLLHELGHAFQALREKMRIEGITLWLLGGVAKFSGMFPSPGAEFRIAIAGPAVSVALAALFALIALAGNTVDLPDVVVGISDYLARINAILFAFNLIPALPMDGGRVLRSWLWRRVGDFQAATALASRAGTAFGVLLIAIGLYDFFTGIGGAEGLWFVFLGWFLIQAAQGEAQAAVLQETLRGLRVGDVMTPNPITVGPRMTIDQFLETVVHGRGHTTYPVVDETGVRGLVSLRHAGSVPVDQRTSRTVAQEMLPVQQVTVVRPQQRVEEVFDAFGQSSRRAVVVDDGRVVGILSPADVVRAIELEQLRRPPERVRRRSAGIVVWVVVGVLMLAAAGYLFTPPIVALRPGAALDVSGDFTISGVPTEPVNGRYLLTSVELDRPNGLEALFLAVTNQAELAPLSSVIPEGIDEQDYARQQREIFRQSQSLAAAAAGEAAGLHVSATGGGARVVEVVPSSPAATVLRPGDIITAIDGRPVHIAADLQDAIASKPAGTTFRLTVRRGGEELTEDVQSRRLEQLTAGGVGIGVVISTVDFNADLPFEIQFKRRNVGGPSAGLAYALAITDMLDARDYANGESIGATGTIDVNGEVGPVGGVEEKAVALVDANADVFLVPQQQVDDVTTEDIDVRGVSSLEEALRVLGAIGSA
jgi:PDZ domain-containing secreted protein/Zn-dependent protease/CBS domain-containing protein